MTVRILVTGSRDWSSWDVMNKALAEAWAATGYELDATLVHGDARGADRMAAEIWRSRGLPVEPHPADWSQGKVAGHWRNQAMVDLGARLCLAFMLPESRGTRDCVARAEVAGIPTIVYHEDS